MNHPPLPAVAAEGIRRIILEQSKRAGIGHIGSALSIADILASLYGDVLQIPDVDAPERDRFVLSKGHAALALYAALHLRGLISSAQMESFCTAGTLLGVHPSHCLPGIDFSTGSLGMGLSFAAGAVLAARFQGSARRSFALLSDAECNEGAVWEAAMFAAHHRLGRLCAIIDLNGQQGLGYTKEVLRMEPMAARWEAFGWRVTEVDGHDRAALTAALGTGVSDPGQPHLVLAHTTFGHGVSFMESQIAWHYLPMSDEQFATAMAGLAHSDDALA